MTESLKNIVDSAIWSLLYRLERKRYCLVEYIKTTEDERGVGLHMNVLRGKPGHSFTQDTTRLHLWIEKGGAKYKIRYEIYEPCPEFVNSFYLRSIVTEELISWWTSVRFLLDSRAHTEKNVSLYKKELIQSCMNRPYNSLIGK